MLTIQPQYLSLWKLFEGRLFQIPEYQRAYSWTTRQRKDLFDDIRKTSEKGQDAAHFMAAVVCLRRKKQRLGTSEFFVMDVVDGQQRLTTLIVIINAIRLALNEKERAQAKLAGELAELLVKVEGDELLILQTNHDSSHYFADYLRNGVAPESEVAKTLADREILEAIEECGKFVGEWHVPGKSLLDLAALVKNQLYFLLHEINEEETVYSVFEVLNSRGLSVSCIDRLKSTLMGKAFELENANRDTLIDELHTTWRDIYSVIGLRQGMSTEALRFASTLHAADERNRPLSEEDSVESFSTKASSAKKIREVSSWLLEVTKACDKVVDNKRVNAVTVISQARLLATAIYLRNDFSGADQKRLLERWEKVTFRIYGMLDNDARFRVGEYVRLAWQVVNDRLGVKAIDDAIRKIGHEFPIEDALDNLRDENCYEDWETQLRYVMYRYEEYLANQKKMKYRNEQWEKIWISSPSDSIEHIWPQSKAPVKHRHRLGNLVMLPPKLNSRLKDWDPKDKASEYRQTGLLIAADVADIIENGGWNRKAIEDREEKMLEWAAKEWAG